MSQGVGSQLPHLSGRQIQQALPISDAVDILEEAFRGEPPVTPARSHYQANGGELLLMPAWGPIGMGVKMVTLEHGNGRRSLPLVQAVYVLFSAEGLQPIATLDGTALTLLRTSAVSAIGVRHLGRKDARTLVLFGAGSQAAAHIEAIAAVRDLTEITIVGRGGKRAEQLAARVVSELGIDCRAENPTDLTGADLICCCTTSREPVVHGEMIPDGCHVTAIGAYRPDAREVDALALKRARVIVESREAALREAGDLVLAIAHGEWAGSEIDGELSDLVSGRARRRDDREITLFKTVGLGSEDLVLARAAAERVGVGTQAEQGT